jgi:hypothetical protein
LIARVEADLADFAPDLRELLLLRHPAQPAPAEG